MQHPLSIMNGKGFLLRRVGALCKRPQPDEHNQNRKKTLFHNLIYICQTLLPIFGLILTGFIQHYILSLIGCIKHFIVKDFI
jgi:hypothetical protein